MLGAAHRRRVAPFIRTIQVSMIHLRLSVISNTMSDSTEEVKSTGDNMEPAQEGAAEGTEMKPEEETPTVEEAPAV